MRAFRNFNAAAVGFPLSVMRVLMTSTRSREFYLNPARAHRVPSNLGDEIGRPATMA